MKEKEEKLKMEFKTLEAWLSYIESIHPEKIDLGLERVREVAGRLDLLKTKCPVVTVGGTNGKGSTVAGLEAIYLAEGYKVGAFTSPYLFRHTEEVRINGIDAKDSDFCQAFASVEYARANVLLTLFEFNTLAALVIFNRYELDVILLEVGLGGRLDAVNIIDADVSVITSIAIDHASWLGNTRELIGKEKAGIFRKNKPVVCGDSDPPNSLIVAAAGLDAPFFSQGKDFNFTEATPTWCWHSDKSQIVDLPLPCLALQNMSTVLMTIECMQPMLPVSKEAIVRGIESVRLPGRLQILAGDVVQMLDVSHNPAAAMFLAKALAKQTTIGKKRAVFSILADKDILQTILVMKQSIDEWYIAPLKTPRAASLDLLKEAFALANVKGVNCYGDLVNAYYAAMNDSSKGDWVVIFGSFYVVGEIGKLSLSK